MQIEFWQNGANNASATGGFDLNYGIGLFRFGFDGSSEMGFTSNQMYELEQAFSPIRFFLNWKRFVKEDRETQILKNKTTSYVILLNLLIS